jgi:hypothetical protein
MTSAEYQQLAASLDRQSTEIGRLSTEMAHRFTGMDRRFDEADLRVTELRQEMLGHFDALYHRFERLEQEYHAIT